MEIVEQLKADAKKSQQAARGKIKTELYQKGKLFGFTFKPLYKYVLCKCRKAARNGAGMVLITIPRRYPNSYEQPNTVAQLLRENKKMKNFKQIFGSRGRELESYLTIYW